MSKPKVWCGGSQTFNYRYASDDHLSAFCISCGQRVGIHSVFKTLVMHYIARRKG